MRRCSSCQEENVDDAIFCSGCGTSLETGIIVSAAANVQREPVAPQPPVVSVSNASKAISAGPESALAACPACGSINALDAVFCGNCGSRLAQSEKASEAVADAVPAAMPTSASGAAVMLAATPATQPPPPEHPRLTVAASGVYFDISGRTGLVIGRVDPISQIFPEIDLTAHGGDEGGVSRKHCRVTLAGNQFFVEDLNSSNGTWIGATRLPPGVRTALNNGDQLRLGKLLLNFFSGYI